MYNEQEALNRRMQLFSIKLKTPPSAVVLAIKINDSSIFTMPNIIFNDCWLFYLLFSPSKQRQNIYKQPANRH